MKKLFEIESDCLDIVKQIKDIDKNYYILFNIDKKCFELHNKEQKKNSYCLTFPFKQLDQRCVDYVLKTSSRNFDELFKEIEKDNKKLFEKQSKEILNDFEEKFYDS